MKNWSQSEINLLKNCYITSTNEDLDLLFPNRTRLSVYKKAYSLGLRKAKDIEFINRSVPRKGEKCTSWKGGKKITPAGYVALLRPEHHRADTNGYVLEHIVAWEEFNGVNISEEFCVHHVNGIKTDNRIENLSLMTKSGHTRFHNFKRSKEKKYVK